MNKRKTLAAITAGAFIAGVPIGALSTKGGAQATAATDLGATWYVTCPNYRAHSVLGGRMMTNGDGVPVELVGPAAITLAGAFDFARTASGVFGDGECTPVHLTEVWMIGNIRESAVGPAYSSPEVAYELGAQAARKVREVISG